MGGKKNHLGCLLPNGKVLCLPNETTGTSRNCSYLTGGGELGNDRVYTASSLALQAGRAPPGKTIPTPPSWIRVWKWHTRLKWWLKTHSHRFHLDLRLLFPVVILRLAALLTVLPTPTHPRSFNPALVAIQLMASEVWILLPMRIVSSTHLRYTEQRCTLYSGTHVLQNKWLEAGSVTFFPRQSK